MMSGQFSGFSEDDIRKLEKGVVMVEGVIPHKDVSNRIIKKTSTNTAKSKSKSLSSSNKELLKNDTIANIPEEARLNNSPSKEKSSKIFNKSATESIEEISKSEVQMKNTKTEPIIDLEKFQQEQKRLEEENRRRKELLVKALTDRTEKTNAEAMKLDAIQREVQKLDSLLSNDVSILRKEIESADIEYMQCQKRFEKIEKEYKALKKLCTQKREIKDLLTQHLCTIIQQNEVRKAEKLSQLMKELDLTSAK